MGCGVVRVALAGAVVTMMVPAAAGAQLGPMTETASPPGPGAAAMTDAAAAPAPVPAVLLVEDVEPALPAAASPGFVPPARDAGGYVTPNRNLSPEEKTWHVRVALNVAALGCRGAGMEELVGGYNALLTRGRTVLAATTDAMGRRYQARYGSAWQAQYDDAMTRLYNFWALPPAQAQFCATALTVMREIATIDPAAFPVFAAAVLPRLEEPITGFFAAFDQYRTAHEAWRTRRARAMIAAAVPAGGPVPTTTPAVAALAAVASIPAVTPPPVAVLVVRAGAGEP